MRKMSFVWLSPALTSLGKRFGIDTHYYAKNGAMVTLGHAVYLVRGFVSGYIVARFFDREVYGQYQFMLSVLGSFSVFALSGMAHSVTRAWARGDGFSLSGVMRPQFIATSIVSAALLLCVPFLPLFGREEFTAMFIVSALLFPLAPLAMVHFGGYSVGKARFDLSLKVTVVSSVLVIAATGAIILFRQSALLMLISALAITPLTQLAFSWRVRPPAEKGTKNTQSIVRYAWQLTFATLPSDLVWYLDKLLISYFFGLNQLAVFTVALLIPEQAKIFAKQFIPMAFAKQAAHGDSAQRRRHLLKIVLFGTAVFIAGVTVYIIVVPWLMPILFPEYASHELVMLTSAAAITIVLMPGSLLTQFLEARGMINEVRLSTWIATGVFAVALVTLIPLWGPMGAIVARGLFRLVSVVIAAWFVLRGRLQAE